jgi:hypothetical protein
MANKSQDTWYVSFELRQREKREHARATETFPNEREAKKFARAKLAETQKSVRVRSILMMVARLQPVAFWIVVRD